MYYVYAKGFIHREPVPIPVAIRRNDRLCWHVYGVPVRIGTVNRDFTFDKLLANHYTLRR